MKFLIFQDYIIITSCEQNINPNKVICKRIKNFNDAVHRQIMELCQGDFRGFLKEREQLAVQSFEPDFAIMPSRTELFGLAALEALSAGLPLLVCSNSGLGKALKELPFGSSCVVNSEDAIEWAKAIRTIPDKERLRLREAVTVRESYAEEYHWDGECGRLVERMRNFIQG